MLLSLIKVYSSIRPQHTPHNKKTIAYGLLTKSNYEMLDGEVLTHVINTSLQLIEDINLIISIGYYNK